MRITGIEAWAVTMRLSEPYSIAYESVDHATNVFIGLETNRGITGYGCAAPDYAVTGETAEDVLQSIGNIAGPLIRNSDPLRPAMLLERLRPGMKTRPSALAAIDMALYDIMGKVGNLPLWRLLGGFRDRIKTSTMALMVV